MENDNIWIGSSGTIENIKLILITFYIFYENVFEHEDWPVTTGHEKGNSLFYVKTEKNII